MAARPVPAALKRLLLGSVPIRRGIYIIGMLPATYYFYLGVMDQLGADPQKTLERLLGLWALRFLILTLAVTPLRRLGGPNLVRYRRAMGLLVFYYAALHLTVYMVLDQVTPVIGQFARTVFEADSDQPSVNPMRHTRWRERWLPIKMPVA